MSDWKTDDRHADRWRDDDGPRGRGPRGRDQEGRNFGSGGSRQDRLEGGDYGGMGVQGAEQRRLDSGGGIDGEERFGHSGGIDSGYGGQSGKAGWGPLSQGSTYGQGGAEWGHSGWGGGGSARHARAERDAGRDSGRDYGFRGQGGGGQQWGGERGTYGQQGVDRPAQRSHDRTTQYDPNDREGFVAYGRGYGEAGRDAHDHDHEPGYRDWRDRQLASHDADYDRWRGEQSRKYDSDYKAYRDSRHDTFSKGFQSWRDQQGAGGSEVKPAAAGAALDVVGDNVRNVVDGGSGDAKPHDHKPDEHKH